VTDNKAQNLCQASVNELEIMFEAQIVGKIELANSCSVAAAAKVLQEKCVIEIAEVVFTQADLPSDMRADVAASDTVTFRLPLGHIERFAQCLDKLCEPDPNTRHEVHLIIGRRYPKKIAERLSKSKKIPEKLD
jgi:glucose-6-phosphate dehydrogenase assembly protein OpcA